MEWDASVALLLQLGSVSSHQKATYIYQDRTGDFLNTRQEIQPLSYPLNALLTQSSRTAESKRYLIQELNRQSYDFLGEIIVTFLKDVDRYSRGHPPKTKIRQSTHGRGSLSSTPYFV